MFKYCEDWFLARPLWLSTLFANTVPVYEPPSQAPAVSSGGLQTLAKSQAGSQHHMQAL